MSLENNLSLEKFEETMAGAINSCSNYWKNNYIAKFKLQNIFAYIELVRF